MIALASFAVRYVRARCVGVHQHHRLQILHCRLLKSGSELWTWSSNLALRISMMIQCNRQPIKSNEMSPITITLARSSNKSPVCVDLARSWWISFWSWWSSKLGACPATCLVGPLGFPCCVGQLAACKWIRAARSSWLKWPRRSLVQVYARALQCQMINVPQRANILPVDHLARGSIVLAWAMNFELRSNLQLSSSAHFWWPTNCKPRHKSYIIFTQLTRTNNPK